MSLGARNRFSGANSPASPTATFVVESSGRSTSPTQSLSAGKMSGRDRTSEFMSAVHMLHTPQVGSHAIHSSGRFSCYTR